MLGRGVEEGLGPCESFLFPDKIIKRPGQLSPCVIQSYSMSCLFAASHSVLHPEPLAVPLIGIFEPFGKHSCQSK